tara:strand:- start:380 stop:1426 length:1047 start_codon:yes stop_codon:yes gene_type:complete
LTTCKVSYNLSKKEISIINEFYNSIDHISIDQNIKWSEITVSKKKCYFLFYEKNKLIGYCIAHEKMRYAYVSFGPISINKSSIPLMIELMFKHYKKLNFGQFTIQPGWSILESPQIFNKIAKKIGFKLDDKNNWHSLNIKLNKSNDEILSKFSSNHKRSIKKAYKKGITTKLITEKNDIESLSEIYKLMCQNRKIISPLNDPKKTFIEINNFITNLNMGFILGVFDNKKNLLGGIIIVFQGNTAFYYFGAASPKFKKLPVLHIAFFEAIKISKDNGLSVFDFGGYSKKGEKQMIGINRFKDGFRGSEIKYPELIILKPNYLVYLAVFFLKELNKIWNKRKYLFNPNLL